MIWYIFLGIILLIALSIMIPLKIHVKYKANSDSSQTQDGNLNYENYVAVYLFGFIKVFNKSLNKKDENKKKENNKNKKENAKLNNTSNVANEENKVVNTIYNVLVKFLDYSKIVARLLNEKDFNKIQNSFKFKKLNLKLGINFKNTMLNIYMLTFLSTIISIYISKNANKFNQKKLNYSVNISEKILDLNVDSIIKFKLANTIGIIIKIIYKLRKVEDENVRTRSTSNRKLNDDSYDVYRKYDRC